MPVRRRQGCSLGCSSPPFGPVQPSTRLAAELQREMPMNSCELATLKLLIRWLRVRAPGAPLSEIAHLHTQPRSPTTTGKIERFHRASRTRTLSLLPDQGSLFSGLTADPAPRRSWLSNMVPSSA
jgi:hypothetical protein